MNSNVWCIYALPLGRAVHLQKALPPFFEGLRLVLSDLLFLFWPLPVITCSGFVWQDLPLAL